MRLTLQIKLALGVTGIVIVVMGLSAVWLTINGRARLVEDYRNFAIGITKVAEAGLENAMISRDPTEITSVIRAIGQRENLKGVMILDMGGTIRYSHEPGDVGRTLSQDDPTCRMCHDHPVTDRPKTVILPTRDGGRILRVAKPLLNQPRCQGCHQEHLLGMLITDFSLAEADRQVTSSLAGWLLGVLLTMAGVVGATIGFVYLEVARPLSSFLKVTQSIGEGDINQRVTLVRGDEIGDLAASFDRMMERLAARTRELEALNSVAATVNQSLDLKEVMHRALESVCQVTGAEWGMISLLDDQTDEFVLAASYGMPSPVVEKLTRLKRGEDFNGWVARSGEPMVVDDSASDSRAAIRIEEIKSLVVVPLRARGHVVGTLGTASPARRKFTPDDVALLQTIGHQVVAAMENARLYDETRRLAKTDSLTGLSNRRAMEDKLQEELKRARRYNRPLSVIMADIDHFKIFNDAHGHPGGDLILRRVAELLRTTIRDSDFVARYGGEEFLIILPETSKARGLEVAERIRGAVARERFTDAETQPGGRLTLSLGVASFPEDVGEADHLVQTADDALYSAKRAGRDRVCGA